MISQQHLSQIEKENGLVFALKWSAVGFTLGLCLLAGGCSSLFDNGPERYNTVQGPRRTPLMNPGGESQPVEGQPEATQQSRPISQMNMPAVPQQMPAAHAAAEAQPEPQMPVAYLYPDVPSQEQAVQQVEWQPDPLPPVAQAPAQNQQAQPIQSARRLEEPVDMDVTPDLPVTQAVAPMQENYSVDAEIDQLEAEFEQSQAAQVQMQQAQAEDGWLPQANVDSWMNGEPASGQVAQPAQPAIENADAVPSLVMSKDGTQVRYEAADPKDSYMEAAPAPQQVMEPQQAAPAPMPPVISEEAVAAMPQAVAPQQVQPIQPAAPVSVSQAPVVRSAPQALSASGLIPPGQYSVSASGPTYLRDSRYAVRRAYGQ